MIPISYKAFFEAIFRTFVSQSRSKGGEYKKGEWVVIDIDAKVENGDTVTCKINGTTQVRKYYVVNENQAGLQPIDGQGEPVYINVGDKEDMLDYFVYKMIVISKWLTDPPIKE